ncbi:LPD7 domain-containing protein (plasmid) [Neptuniibacter sp. QD72_48]|uniref:LPD7 domain-containing protein n=1 Tax=Neptuniibacter sp. QD72_48 TaxID=3398214 RepID=UPI0039F5547F
MNKNTDTYYRYRHEDHTVVEIDPTKPDPETGIYPSVEGFASWVAKQEGLETRYSNINKALAYLTNQNYVVMHESDAPRNDQGEVCPDQMKAIREMHMDALKEKEAEYEQAHQGEPIHIAPNSNPEPAVDENMPPRVEITQINFLNEPVPQGDHEVDQHYVEVSAKVDGIPLQVCFKNDFDSINYRNLNEPFQYFVHEHQLKISSDERKTLISDIVGLTRKEIFGEDYTVQAVQPPMVEELDIGGEKEAAEKVAEEKYQAEKKAAAEKNQAPVVPEEVSPEGGSEQVNDTPERTADDLEAENLALFHEQQGQNCIVSGDEPTPEEKKQLEANKQRDRSGIKDKPNAPWDKNNPDPLAAFKKDSFGNYRYRTNTSIIAFRVGVINKKVMTCYEDNQSTAKAMVHIAINKNKWSSIRATGKPEFKQNIWRECQLQGVKCTGYTPSEDDLKWLDRHIESQKTVKDMQGDEQTFNPNVNPNFKNMIENGDQPAPESKHQKEQSTHP